MTIPDFTSTRIEILGSEHMYGPMSNLPQVFLDFLSLTWGGGGGGAV